MYKYTRIHGIKPIIEYCNIFFLASVAYIAKKVFGIEYRFVKKSNPKHQNS